MKWLPLPLMLLVCAATASAQQTPPRRDVWPRAHDASLVREADSAWHSYSSANSPLPAAGFQFVLDRHNGIGWFAGSDSLYSFDGSAWRSYALPASGMPEGLALDSTGDIWGVFNATPSFIIRKHGDSITLVDVSDAFKGTTITSLKGLRWGLRETSNVQAGGNGTIWISGPGLVLRFDGSTWKEFDSDNSTFPINPSNHVVDVTGSLWVGDSYGTLNVFDGTTWKEIHGVQNPSVIHPVAVDRNNHVWAFEQDLKRVTTEFNGKIKVRSENSDSSWLNRGVPVFDTGNNPWVRSRRQEGFARHADSNWWQYTSANSRLPNDSITNMDVDDNGMAWIISSDRILTLLDGNVPPQLAYSVNVALGAPTESGAATDLKLLPNPAASLATARFTLRSASPVHADLVDAAGRTLRVVHDGRMDAGTRTMMIDASSLPAGNYFLRIETGDGIVTKPLVVVH